MTAHIPALKRLEYRGYDSAGVATLPAAADYVGFLIVSVSDRLLERSAAMMKGGDYTEGYYLHGFGVRLAEAAQRLVEDVLGEVHHVALGREGVRHRAPPWLPERRRALASTWSNSLDAPFKRRQPCFADCQMTERLRI